jgi:mRNA degradation ribonuclease J1/J2
MAALPRIVNGDNRFTSIYPGDTVIFSSNPIPGNGALVDRLVNRLVKMGADVKLNSLAFSLHSSGHPSRQELRLMQRLVQPKNFMPVHGEYRMLKLHGEIASQLGLDPKNVFLCDRTRAVQGCNRIKRNHFAIIRNGSFGPCCSRKKPDAGFLQVQKHFDSILRNGFIRMQQRPVKIHNDCPIVHFESPS